MRVKSTSNNWRVVFDPLQLNDKAICPAHRTSNYDSFYYVDRKQDKIPLHFEGMLLVLPLIQDFRKDLASLSVDNVQ